MKQNIKLSAAIATYNEENNLRECLEGIKNLVDEIVVVDGCSTDRTVEIAREFGAKVISVPNKANFHINKQLSFDNSKGEWILYLDSDERVTKELANEIKKIICMSNQEIGDYQKDLKQHKLFLKHQRILEERDGPIDQGNEYVAFFFPRLNYFLGKYLRYGGVYPDGVIRLFKNKKAYLPCKDVHEQLVVLGKVGWLQNSLLHIDSPDFQRYMLRNNRYINIIVDEMRKKSIAKNTINLVNYCLIKPVWWFFLTTFRHKGFLDGYRGILFSFFSALRFPRAYIRYIFQDE